MHGSKPDWDGMDESSVSVIVDRMGEICVYVIVDGMDESSVSVIVDRMGDIVVSVVVDGMDESSSVYTKSNRIGVLPSILTGV